MELEKKADPTPEERMAQMAATIGRMQVESLAQSAGAADAKTVAEVAARFTKLSIDATGTVKIAMVDPETGEKLRTASGEDMTIGQFIAQMKADPDHGWRFQDGASKPKAKPSGGLETETNPWMHPIHLGRQAELLRTAPEYAARLQAAAKGLRPENPWSAEGLNITRQSQILRDDPALAERMQAEIAPKEKNPWKKETFNLTMQILMLRSDKAKARRLQAEAEASNGPAVKKSYIFTPPPGSFKRMGTGN